MKRDQRLSRGLDITYHGKRKRVANLESLVVFLPYTEGGLAVISEFQRGALVLTLVVLVSCRGCLRESAPVVVDE